MTSIDEEKEIFLKKIKGKEDLFKKPEYMAPWLYRYLDLIHEGIYINIFLIFLFFWMFFLIFSIMIDTSFLYIAFGGFSLVLLNVVKSLFLDGPKRAKGMQKAIEEYEFQLKNKEK